MDPEEIDVLLSLLTLIYSAVKQSISLLPDFIEIYGLPRWYSVILRIVELTKC